MAIKDQCSRCTLYNGSTDTCTKSYGTPAYDGHSCESYSRIGGNINLNKGGTINLNKPGETPISAPIPAPPQTPVVPQPSPSSTGGQNSGGSQTTSSKKMFRAPFSFDGRIRRLEYGLSFLIVYFFELPMNILKEDQIGSGFAIIWLLLLIPALWFFYAQGAKRCHDLGHNGWWQLIPFYWFWMVFEDGEGTNQYGPSPKY